MSESPYLSVTWTVKNVNEKLLEWLYLISLASCGLNSQCLGIVYAELGGRGGGSSDFIVHSAYPLKPRLEMWGLEWNWTERKVHPDSAGRKLKSERGCTDNGVFKNRTKYFLNFETVTVFDLAYTTIEIIRVTANSRTSYWGVPCTLHPPPPQGTMLQNCS